MPNVIILIDMMKGGGYCLKYIFTEEDKKKEINVIFIEDDNVLVRGEFITKEEDGYILNGSAVIDEETYHDFEVFFALTEEIEFNDIEAIKNAEWDWNDYVC